MPDFTRDRGQSEAIHEQENPSIRKLAQRFGVAKSFVQKLLKQYRETGSVQPRPQGGPPPRKLQEEQLLTLMEVIESMLSFTTEKW